MYGCVAEGGETMRNVEPLGSVALRHVLEDAIALIRDHAGIEETRRASVLGDLENLLNEARKGSELSHAGALFVAPSNKGAFEAYSLINRHLEEAVQNWGENLVRSLDAVKALRSGVVPNDEDVRSATSLLESLLKSLRKHTRGELRREPREFNFVF